MENRIAYPSAQKAVAAIVAIGPPLAAELLKRLTKGELTRLHNASKMMSAVTQRDLEVIVDEFEAQFTNGTGLLDSGEQISSILKESFPAEELDFLNGEVTQVNLVPQRSAWGLLDEADDRKVAGFLLSESPQLAAYICARLPGAKVAKILAHFDRASRSSLLTRMITAGAPNKKIELMVESEIIGLFGGGSENAANEGVEKVAAILNELERVSSEEVLSDFGDELGDDALRAIKGKLFRFDDLASLDGEALTKIFDGFSTDHVTLALRGAPKEVCEAVLAAVSQRTRRIIENDLKSSTTARPSDVAAARTQITSLAMRLAADGRIELTKNDILAA